MAHYVMSDSHGKADRVFAMLKKNGSLAMISYALNKMVGRDTFASRPR